MIGLGCRARVMVGRFQGGEAPGCTAESWARRRAARAERSEVARWLAAPAERGEARWRGAGLGAGEGRRAAQAECGAAGWAGLGLRRGSAALERDAGVRALLGWAQPWRHRPRCCHGWGFGDGQSGVPLTVLPVRVTS
ncbi:hypothetical protein L3i22_011000 [Actinoplanes sp. L3-i22]|nr:hypothetical protein L3i22_011000 [Actinoplanes sp. L3-i22]